MRILVHIEPVWFRNDATFLAGHFPVLIQPILSALARDADEVELGFSSNVLQCMAGVEVARQVGAGTVSVRLFVSQVDRMLEPMGFSTSAYCRDIFRDAEALPNRALADRMTDIMDSFAPDIAITTSRNRYLEAGCAAAGVPLICTEMGPLPRMGFPQNRHVSIGRHLSWRLDPAAGRPAGPGALNTILTTQARALSLSPTAAAIESFVQSVRSRGSVAILALQPSDWVTWDGALDTPLSPAEIVLTALDRMDSDQLIVLFHPDPLSKVNADILTEIWLSDRRLLRAPDALSSGLAEEYMPHVDECVKVSSNLGFLALLLGKRLTPLGESVLSDLAAATSDPQECREALAANLLENVHVDAAVFTDPGALRGTIADRMEAAGYRDRAQSLACRPVARPATATRQEPYADLELIHRRIRASASRHDEDEMYRLFGRNFLGYALPAGTVGAELGVAAGYFSESLLRSGRLGRPYSIDAWSDHHDEAEYRTVCARLARFGERSEIRRQTFDAALAAIPDGSLNFIYVDGYAHTGMNAEIVAQWLPKLARNAVVAGHDYCAQIWPVNHTRVSGILATEGFGPVRVIPGVLTGNTEDVIPSFSARYLDGRAPEGALTSFWSRLRGRA